MQNEDEEDESTVIIDFNTLAGELNQDEELTTNKIDLQFNVDYTEQTTKPDAHASKQYQLQAGLQIVLFEYRSNYFAKNLANSLAEQNIHLITELDQLNALLREHPDAIIIFYYNDQPKIVNQLCLQIKSKFTGAKTIIIAEHLSEQKAQLHAESKYAANSYISHPFDLESFYAEINSLE